MTGGVSEVAEMVRVVSEREVVVVKAETVMERATVVTEVDRVGVARLAVQTVVAKTVEE